MSLPSEEVSQTALDRAQELSKGLYPHQVEGVAFLLARRRAILADDMGLGKTRQSIVAMREAAPDGPWLVVCPASVKRNWQREIYLVSTDSLVKVIDSKTTVPGSDYRGWIVVNYDIVKRQLPSLISLPFAGFVFDEAHYLKNHQAQRTKATRKLLDDSNAPIVHCLTGTPMTNRPRDLFPLLQLVGHPLGKSFLGFAKRYCDAHKGDFGWETKGASNLDELAVQLHGTMLRRTKDEVLDLPEKLRTWLNVDIQATRAKRGLRRVLATLLKETSDHAKHAGDVEGRLPPISRPKLIARLTPVRADTAGAKMKYTTEFAKGILDQGEKIIIYSCFQEVIETFLDDFQEYGVRFLTGGVSSEHRQRAVDDFQNNEDVRVFLSTVIAGGVGITLTAARTVIFNDLDWVPANHWQAEDRAYRIGQIHPVNVYYLKASGSIDEFVGQVLETKCNLINAVVEGQALSDHHATGNVLDDLERVVGDIGLMESGTLTDGDLETAMSEAVALYEKSIPRSVAATTDPLHKPQTANRELIRALARALSPPMSTTKFRIASSRAGEYYELEVDGSDVVCGCRGFEYRGQCKHARALKDALAGGESIPPDYERI